MTAAPSSMNTQSARGRAHRLGTRRPAERGVGGAAREGAPPADAAGHYRYPFPKEYGGQDGTNLGMAVIREHLARKGLGLHNDLQNEHSIVGNNVGLLLMINYGTDEQKAEWIDDLAEGRARLRVRHHRARPRFRRDAHGDRRGARRRRVGHQRREDVEHRHPRRAVRPDLRPHERQRRRRRTASPRSSSRPTSPGFEIVEFLWTFNMPTDHAHIRLTDVRVPHAAIFGGEGRGLQVVQHFFNENRIRQAASSLGAAQFCIDRVGRVREGARAVRQAAVDEPGDPVPARRAADAVRDAARADPQDRVVDGHLRRVLGVRQGLDVQLLGEPAVLRSGRPGDAGARRPRLLAAQAVRAHLPPPPPLPHHRRQRGDPDAPRRRLPVRLHEAAGPEGSRTRERASTGRRAFTSSPFVAAVEPITETDDEIRAALAEAEVPPLLPRSRTSPATSRCCATSCGPTRCCIGDAAGRADRRAAGARPARSRSTRSSRFRDGGCVPAPPPADDELLRIMEFAVGGAEMARVPPAARGGARATAARTGARPAGARPTSRPTSTSACVDHRRGHVGPARRAPAAAGRRRLRRSSRRTTTSAAPGSRTRYPGCRVDNPNHNYSYSFAQRHDWPFHFSTQDVLLDYFRRCADAFGCATTSASAPRCVVGRPGPTTTQRVDGRACATATATRRRSTANAVDQRGRPAQPAALPRHRRPRLVRGPVVPLRAVGPRRRPRAASASR